jgi:YfiH family protein
VIDSLSPDWPAPPGVCALTTLRGGGVSRGAYASANMGDHVGDDPWAVQTNRAQLAGMSVEPIAWLTQVHGIDCVSAQSALAEALSGQPVHADAAFTREAGIACAILTADCLPLLLCAEDGSIVSAVHAGWRGLCAGVIESALSALALPGSHLLAWLGPAIGPKAYRVGEEVMQAFVAQDPGAKSAFMPVKSARESRWYCDLYALARQRLHAQGVKRIYGGTLCTYTDDLRFYSYRRASETGRMATLIWRRP